MPRPFVTTRLVTLLTTVLILSAAAAPARAQGGYTPPKRLELTPFGSYQWGGSFDTQGLGSILAGEINEKGSFSWGAILSFLAAGNSAVELYYLRQDTDVEFKPNAGQTRTVGSGFSNNYVQLGVRQGLPRTEGIAPFITARLKSTENGLAMSPVIQIMPVMRMTSTQTCAWAKRRRLRIFGKTATETMEIR